MKAKVLPIILIVALSSARLSAQGIENKEVQFLIDTCITIMQQKAVNASSTNWKKVKETAYQKARGLNGPYELGSVMRYLYESVQDFHGAFFYRDSTFQWHRKEGVINDSIRNEWKKGVRIKTQVLKNKIGYLRVPSMPGGSIADFSAKAQSLNDSLCSLLNQNVKGIILDLRLNGGGAMFPMILGLEQLLGSGKVGSFQTKKNEDWIIKDHKFFIDTAILSTITPTCTNHAEDMPVVMLTGPATGSSGEFLVMAFKGRPKTVQLGSATAGYITINSGIQINDTAAMNLSVGYGADRKGRFYKEAIKPEIVIIAADSFNDLEFDAKIIAAEEWLKTHFK